MNCDLPIRSPGLHSIVSEVPTTSSKRHYARVQLLHSTLTMPSVMWVVDHSKEESSLAVSCTGVVARIGD